MTKPQIVKVDVTKDQKPTDYLVVRCQLVNAKKGVFGLKDNTLAIQAVIPNTRIEAAELYGKIKVLMEALGVSVVG